MDLVVVLSLFLCLGRVLGGSTDVDRRPRGAREGLPHVRPKRETSSVKGSFHVSPEHVYLQTNQNHSIPCLSWAGEEISLTTWRKGDLELASSASQGVGEDYRLNDRYGISDDHALVVKNVQKDDQGVYICKVVFKTGLKKDNSIDITVTVLDTLFPATNGDLVANASLFLERGQRHELRCPILAMETAAGSYTIYWSEDIGDTNFTRIIGARYSDGETKVMDNYNGDYDVKEGDLVAKSFNKLSTRLWCHLFREGSPWMLSGYIGVTGKVTAKTSFPAISQCGSNERCTIKAENENLRLNCSVENIYPELDELSWAVTECDTPVSISTVSYLMYNKTTETFIQKEELRMNLSASASINCSLTCLASGLAIVNSPVTATVFVTGPTSQLVPCANCDVNLGMIIAIIMALVAFCILAVGLYHHRYRYRCVICLQRHGYPKKERSNEVNCDGNIEMKRLNVGGNSECQTAAEDEQQALLVQQDPSASASAQIETKDYTEDSVSQKAGPSSYEPYLIPNVRVEHTHFTAVINIIPEGFRYLRDKVLPRKRGATAKSGKKRTAKRNETSAPATLPPDDFPEDDEAETQSKQSKMQQRKAPINQSKGNQHCVVIEMEEKDSVKSGEIRAADVPLPDFRWEDEETETPSEWQGRQRQNSLDNTSTRDELSIHETIVEEKQIQVPEAELQKEDDYITKIDDEQDTSISHLETQQLLETENNIKKEMEEVERVSSVSDEEESEAILLEIGTDAILLSPDISDEQVHGTDQSEKLLLQATLSDVNSNEERTTQEEVPSTVQTNPEMTDTDESHGSSGEDLTAVPKPTPPCERPSLDSAAGHPQPSFENSHADSSPHQLASATENPLMRSDDEMGSDDSDDITDDVINEIQKANRMEVAGHESLNESTEPHVQDTPATNYDQERGNPTKENTKKKKGSNKPYSRPEKSTASFQHDKKAAAVQDRSEQCGHDMEADVDEVGFKSTDAPADVAIPSDKDARPPRPLLKEKETGIRESQMMKTLKAANPLKTENIMKERDAHRCKPPSSVHH